ncbi:MAG: DUF4432 family protein [Spirochaetales bacterium]|nr:MAG: DUF4432 family protein [Spirochaetales bacterium]
MSEIFGKIYSKQELAEYTGSMSQLAGIRACELEDGRAKGTSCFDIRTGSGLDFSVIKDRCLDIAWASFKGTPISHITKTGIAAPWFFEPQENGWFRTYFAGLLTTCGLSNTGAFCEDDGERYGLHGRISNTPAEAVAVREYWEGNEYRMQVTGSMRESRFYGENLLLTRTITTALGWKKFIIHDRVENQGFEPVPVMILYHFNIGFPLLSENSELIISALKTDFYDDAARQGASDMFRFQKPTHGYFRQVFFHSLRNDEQGNTQVMVVNRNIGKDFLGLYLKFNHEQLPEFFEFKMMGQGDYELGLEPSNCLPMGRAFEKSRKGLKYIEGQTAQDFEIEVGIIETEEEARGMAATIGAFKDKRSS